MKKQIEQTITTLEIAEMMGVPHYEIIKKLEGTFNSDGSIKQVGIIPTLTHGSFPVSDYFIPSTYKDASGKENKCYNATKLGCDMLANKFTGEKGIIFTARYVKRFHDMEDTIKKGIPQKEKSDKSKSLPLPSVNTMVKNVAKYLEKAGVDDLYIAAEVKRLYTDSGYPVNAPLITDKETMPKLYDCTEIAKELGIYSTSGKPHSQAVGAIIKKLHIEDSEIVTTAFSRNGHDDVTTQYKPSVFEDVKLWLAENNYPTKITYIDSKGNPKTCTVAYQEVA